MGSYFEPTRPKYTGRLGRQPNASYRSEGDSPLPLVANIVKKLTIFGVSSTEPRI